MSDLDAEWRADAACLGMGADLFFFEGNPAPSLVAICQSCPVCAECLADALEHGEMGWRGGTSEPQRVAMGGRKAVVVTYPTVTPERHLRVVS
jgi:WhiB family redox-sensing transcriptional regulator